MTFSNSAPHQQPIPQIIKSNLINRNEAGLFISGTRISLYDVMDLVIAQYPAKFISNMLNLSQEQVQAALEYIETHKGEVESEYQSILTEASDLQQYWQDRNRELNEKVTTLPAPTGKEAAWQKLQSQKARKLLSKA